MKIPFKLWCLIFALASIWIAGCATRNPASSANGGPDTNAPAYVASPKIASAFNEAQAAVNNLGPLVAAAYPPAAPAIPLAGVVLGALATIVTGISSGIAVIKTNSAKTHSKAAAALATGVQGDPAATAKVMAAAAVNGSSGAVAVHLANAASPV